MTVLEEEAFTDPLGLTVAGLLELAGEMPQLLNYSSMISFCPTPDACTASRYKDYLSPTSCNACQTALAFVGITFTSDSLSLNLCHCINMYRADYNL